MDYTADFFRAFNQLSSGSWETSVYNDLWDLQFDSFMEDVENSSRHSLYTLFYMKLYI